MKLTQEVKNEIIYDREENNGDLYTDEHLSNMKKRRFAKLCEIENKEVWMENGVYFIDDENDKMYGFKQYNPTSKNAKRYASEIIFLLRVLESF